VRCHSPEKLDHLAAAKAEIKEQREKLWGSDREKHAALTKLNRMENKAGQIVADKERLTKEIKEKQNYLDATNTEIKQQQEMLSIVCKKQYELCAMLNNMEIQVRHLKDDNARLTKKVREQ
jgi:chromosome segregation ATPase